MKPATDATFNTHPSRLASRIGATALVQCKALQKFTRKYFSKPSGRIWSNVDMKGAAPALFTRMSMVPWALTVRSTRFWIWLGSVTSVGTARARPPEASISPATARRSCSPLAARATAAPASAKARATALPIPLLAPVTMALFPSSEKLIIERSLRRLAVRMQSKAQDGDLHATVASVRSRWERSAFSVDELAQALVNGRVAGPITSHDRRNVLNRIERLVLGDPDVQFGLSGLTVLTPREVLALVAEEAGFDPDPGLTTGPSPIDPYRVLEACRRSGQRLAAAADRGERVLLATGHPAGLLVLYQAIAALLEAFGAKLLRPLIGLDWREEGKHREVRYLQGVAVLTDRASTRHTHAPVP